MPLPSFTCWPIKYESINAVGNGAPTLAKALPTLPKTLLLVAALTGSSPTLTSIGLSAAYFLISDCDAISPFVVSNAPTSLFHLKFVSLNVSASFASSGLGNLSAVVICPVSIKFASFCESFFNSFKGPLVAVIALFNFTAAAFGSAFIIASHASMGPPNALVTTARQPPGIDLTFCAKESTILFFKSVNP